MIQTEKPNLADNVLGKDFTFAARTCWVVDDTIGYKLIRRSTTTRYSDVSYAHRNGVIDDIINDMQQFLGTRLERCRTKSHTETHEHTGADDT